MYTIISYPDNPETRSLLCSSIDGTDVVDIFLSREQNEFRNAEEEQVTKRRKWF